MGGLFFFDGNLSSVAGAVASFTRYATEDTPRAEADIILNFEFCILNKKRPSLGTAFIRFMVADRYRLAA